MLGERGHAEIIATFSLGIGSPQVTARGVQGFGSATSRSQLAGKRVISRRASPRRSFPARTVRALQSAQRMTANCTYVLPHGSTETMPWVQTFCYTDDVVSAGCPLHFVSADPTPSDVTVNRWHGFNDTITTTPSTVAALGSTTEQVLGGGPDCGAEINASVQFTRYEVMAPALAEGDSFFITYQAAGGPAGGANTAPTIAASGGCSTPSWPTTYYATCGFGGDAGLQPPAQPEPAGGCSAGGDPSMSGATLLLLALGMTVRCSRRTRCRR